MTNRRAYPASAGITSKVRSQSSDNLEQPNSSLATKDFSDLLDRWREGDAEAEKRVASLIYDELHGLARYYMQRESGLHTLQPTALIHEAYIRLLQEKAPPFTSKDNLLAFLARLMRQVLINHAHKRQTIKRGNGRRAAPLESWLAQFEEPSVDLLALDEALDRLSVLDSRQARIVELRFFGGLTIDETAAATNLSPRTIVKEWAMARAWLRKEIDR